MKKFLSLVLALVMTMSLVTISAGAKDFTDDSTITYAEAVDVMSAIKVVGGYADGSFNPQGGLTRGAAAKIICNLILGPTTADALNADAAPYKDVPVGSTYAGYIAYCAKEGIISGYADGTFRPAAPLTGYAFMKMLLGALGYDASVEGYTGANWSISVAKRALGIGLDKGLVDDFVGSKALTREEACLYAFNTLKAKTVTYPNSSTIVVGDITVSTSSIAQETSQKFMQKYFSKLKEVAPYEDAFGRPATTWQYKGEKIGTYADEADASYTVKVSSDTIYGDLGLSATKTATVKVDGEDAANFTVKDNDKDTKIGDTGVLTECFLVKDSDGNVTGVKIVEINTYIGQIDDVDTNDDDERIVEIGSLSYVTEEFEEDDYVLYTVDKSQSPDEIKSMVLVEKQTGELTKKVGSSKFTIDGEVYSAAATIEDGTDTAYKVGKDVDFYLDTYGNIIKIDAASTEISVENMALVLTGGADRSKGWVSALLSDGTKKELDTDKNYIGSNVFDTNGDGTDDDDAQGQIVSYEINDDGDYELTYVANKKDSTATVKSGNPAMGTIKTNNATQFVYAVTQSNGTVKYTTYVGYKNIPSTTTGAATLTSYTPSNASVAALVYVEVNYTAIASTAKDITVIAYDKDVSATNEGTNKVYYEYNAVVDGEVTTVKVLPSQWATIAGNDFYAVESITYNTNNIGTLGSQYATTNANTIEVSGDTVIVGGAAKSFDDDTIVVLVDDGVISVIDVDDIQKDNASNGGTKDPYKTISYSVDSNDSYILDVVILVKN